MSFAFRGAGPRSTVLAQVRANASPHDGRLGEDARDLVEEFLVRLGDDEHTYAVKCSGHSGDGQLHLELTIETFGKLPEEIVEADEVAQELLSEAAAEKPEPGWASSYPLG